MYLKLQKEIKEQKTEWVNGKTPWQCLLDYHRGKKTKCFIL